MQSLNSLVIFHSYIEPLPDIPGVPIVGRRKRQTNNMCSPDSVNRTCKWQNVEVMHVREEITLLPMCVSKKNNLVCGDNVRL